MTSVGSSEGSEGSRRQREGGEGAPGPRGRQSPPSSFTHDAWPLRSVLNIGEGLELGAGLGVLGCGDWFCRFMVCGVG